MWPLSQENRKRDIYFPATAELLQREVTVTGISSCFAGFVCWRPLIKSNIQVSGSKSLVSHVELWERLLPHSGIFWNGLNAEFLVGRIFTIPFAKWVPKTIDPYSKVYELEMYPYERDTVSPLFHPQHFHLLYLLPELRCPCLLSWKDLPCTSSHERTRGNLALTFGP